MKTRLWPLLCLCVGGPLWLVTATQVIAVEEFPADFAQGTKTGEIQLLIDQLGDEQYLQRQLAETRLIERGAEAFTGLQAALHHPDLEIVVRAKYILNQISIEWARPTDPAVVQSIMARYGELAQASRLAKVAQLARLENEQGFGPLCRVSRFDTSSQVVRYAALSILENGFLPAERTAAAVAVLTDEMGESDQGRLPWIGVYVDQLQTPDKIDSRWIPLIDAEIALFAEETGETDLPFVVSLLRCHLELCDKVGDSPAIFANWQRRIDLTLRDGQESNAGLVAAFTWVIDHEQWEALKLLEHHYADVISRQRLLVYLMASARDKQGRRAEATEFATRAYQTDASGDLLTEAEAQERNRCADLIAELGRHDWAEREWHFVIEALPATDAQSLIARNSLALYRLHDRGDHQTAADLLNETIEAINKDPVVKQQYQQSGYRAFLRSAASNREFFLACHFEAQQDYKQQRRHLDRAYRLSPGNADVLIAMYRLQDVNDDYRRSTTEKISNVQLVMEKEIKESPDDAQGYNQWAWLISNTEGDFAKAVERSKHSLKLRPESPSYMDTLGRCYYAAGDLEKAVKIQRKAVAKHPHMMVMQRQLKFFEDEQNQRAGADTTNYFGN